MIVNFNNVKDINCNGYTCYEANGIRYYYKGIFFIRGVKEGIASLKVLAEYFNEKNALDFESYMGAFHFVIIKDDEIILFTDNNSLRGFFISNNHISDNFINILKKEKGLSFDDKAISEYFFYGQCFFNKTLVKEVKISHTNKYYILKNKKLIQKDKNIANIDGRPDVDNFEMLYNDIGNALSGKNLSLALTGGFDSRFVLTLLKDAAHIDVCISGDLLENKDIEVSKKVAEVANLKHDVEIIKKPEINEAYVRKMFYERDAALGGFDEQNIRIYELLKIRKSKGYDVHMTGDTGVLYKDEHWVQELPFYKKKNFNIEKFYKQRIQMIKHSLPISDDFISEAKDAEQDIIHWMKENRREFNTKSFDWYNWNMKYPTGIKKNMTSMSNLITIYAPLLELKSVRYSYNLPRKKRFRGNIMKEMITKIAPDIARIKTVTGVTTSKQYRYVFNDFVYDIINYIKKAIRLGCRIVLKKTLLVNNVLSWSCESEIRKLGITKDAIKFAKNSGILKNDVKESEISYSLLGKILNIYLIGEILNDSQD